MEYLTENQIGIAKSCIANINDKMKAVEMEIMTRQRPYKNYLNEKLDSIRWDLQVLSNLAKPDKSVPVEKDTKLLLQNILDEINVNCKKDSIWNEDLFPSYEWNELWNLTEKVINTSKIDEQQLDTIVSIENIICMKENDEDLYPIEEETHERLIDIMNYLCDYMSRID